MRINNNTPDRPKKNTDTNISVSTVMKDDNKVPNGIKTNDAIE